MDPTPFTISEGTLAPRLHAIFSKAGDQLIVYHVTNRGRYGASEEFGVEVLRDERGAVGTHDLRNYAERIKKKFRKVTLGVDVNSTAISKKTMDDCVQEEAQLQQADRIILETGEKRNELESFIYAMRDEIIGELREYVSDADKATFENALNEAEDWLYNGDGYETTKSKYVEKLGNLQDLSAPITERKFEATARPAAVEELKKEAQEYLKWANTSEEKYAHISEDDRAKVRAACNDAETWVNDMLGKQGDECCNFLLAAFDLNPITMVTSP